MTKKDSSPAPAAALPDAAARRAIAEDLGTTMLVEAAAGTGKTTSLVDRMVALIATGAARVENLSAVTFTIRAAAQLRQRFQNELEKRHQAETDRERRERMDAALRGLDSSFLGTIHAFCARLLRERPVEARVDPDFREMDDPEDNIARARAWERFVGRLFAANAPIIVRLAGLGIRVQDLERAYDALCENSDVEPSIGPETAEPDFSGERRKLDAFLDQAAGAVRAEAGPEGWTGFEQAIRRALRLRSLLDVGRGAEFARVLQALKSSKAKEKAPRAFKPAVEALQEDVVKPALVRWAEHVHPIAMPILVDARNAYRAWRRQNGLMNFQDLLLDARDLLRDRADVRRALFRRFTPILVDEFQDTDPIQAELLFYLTGTDAEERDWKKLAPAAGSLFVVGDPKQSIYRFRRADVETYSVVRNRIEETGGRIVALSSNFRSTAPLCEWINAVFGRPDFFPADRTPAQAAYVPLSVGRARESRGPSVLRLDVPASGNRNEPVIREDAERIGRSIADAIASGERGPGDFLILFRRRRNMKAYARELERRGVPYEIAGGGAFGESAELAALVPVLEALADPDNPVPFVAALRGPIFGVDDDALYRFVRAGGRFRFTADLPGSTDPRIRRAADLLMEGAKLVDALPPAAAIARLCDRLGITALAGAEELGESRTGNLLKALAAARKFSGEGRDFPAVVAELTRMRDEDLIEQMSVDPGRPRIVRLMSLHGAKGLEAPVVFLADPSWDGRFPRDYWIDRDIDPPAGHFRIIQKVGQRGEIDLGLPRQWAEMGRIEDEFEDAERIRLLYVGSTRAQDLLVVSIKRTAAGKASGPWAALAPLLPSELPRPAGVGASPGAPAFALPEDLAASRARRAARKDFSARHSYAVSTVTHVAHTGPRPTWERTGRGMSWGRVLHRLLEGLMRDGKLDVDAYAANLLAEEERSPSDLEELVRTVEAVRGSDLWKRAAAAPRRLVEVPFALMVPREDLGLAEGPAETLLQGAIDLVFEENGAWSLVDYKSDTVGGKLKELVAFYTPQIAIYRRYWERLTGAPTRAGLFFADGGREVWPSITG